ncbi:MAG: insulinase family protein, partial [Armatimonadetes bacterium]|nr:insulinase family protein [Armatimonadota bacterium]
NEIAKDVEQVHFCIGGDGCSYYDDDLYVATVLDHVLGGGMSSRLFQEIREKRGLAYAIGSYSLTFTSGGSFTVYGGTSPDKWDEVQQIIRNEFDKFVADGAEEEELLRTKRSLAGGIVLGLEAMSVRMMRMARNEIVFGRQIPVEEVLEKLNAVTNEDLVRYGSTCLDEARISTTAIGPFS